MKLTNIIIKNYKSIQEIDDIVITPLQIFIGENNVGKSNILKSLEVFLTAGIGGIKESDFNDATKPIIIGAKFTILSDNLKKIWKPYLINDELILEKHIWIEEDSDSEKITIKNEYHGYKAEPKDWFLSVKKISDEKGARPNWKDIVSQNNLPSYFLESETCNKTLFTKALEKYLSENEVEYEKPDVSTTQALGFQSKTIANLPKFYLLRAETSYSDEIDKRSSNTTFRKLMADLSDRIIKDDPRYEKIELAVSTIKNLLNDKNNPDPEKGRLVSLGIIENKIKEILCKLMPTVEKVNLKVETEDIQSIFSRGVELTVDDGCDTDVLSKGHGLQRCIIFSLLQALILNERKELISNPEPPDDKRPIILAIEEPELYIHPQLGKLFYDVLLDFSKTDQVMYSTHSPRFIDVYNYESIGLVHKDKSNGTKINNCDLEQFKDLDDRKVFQGLTQLNSDVNELFFAKKIILVEGPEDKIAITETLKKTKQIENRPEEKDITVIVAGGKSSIPFFIRILNAFKMSYVVLHDLDITSSMSQNDKDNHTKINQKIKDLANDKIVNFPIKLEDTLSLAKGHFKDQYTALSYFTEHSNINNDLETIINKVIEKIN